MDLLMPGIDGIAATRVIRRELPDTQVVAVTSVLETESIVAAIRAGAIGYVLKNANAADLCRAVKAAAEGQVELSPAAQQRLLRELIIPASPEVLTDRETEVLRMVAHGCSNKEIARCLDIAEKTVKNHVASILDKLGVASRTQAAMFAVHAGLVAAEPLAYAE
jgi:DNA-binding NarL/FixJ family response regulator